MVRHSAWWLGRASGAIAPGTDRYETVARRSGQAAIHVERERGYEEGYSAPRAPARLSGGARPL
jgi:hypothetical protein